MDRPGPETVIIGRLYGPLLVARHRPHAVAPPPRPRSHAAGAEPCAPRSVLPCRGLGVNDEIRGGAQNVGSQSGDAHRRGRVISHRRPLPHENCSRLVSRFRSSPNLAARIVGRAGNAVERGFCVACGSQVTLKLGRLPDVVGVQAGSLDDPSIYRPAMDIFTESAQAWDHMSPTTQKLPGGVPS